MLRVSGRHSAVLIYIKILCYVISSVPAPVVSTSPSIHSSVYQGTELIIKCTVTVHSAVDTGFDVIVVWKSSPPQTMNGLYVTITNTSGSGDTFTSTVTISPVNTTDTASYTCTARVNPTAIDGDFIII